MNYYREKIICTVYARVFFVSLQAVLQLTSIVLNNIRDKNTKTQQYY